MSAFQAIQYVGGGLSLVAFVVAAFLYAYRAKLRSHIEIIRSAPENDRLQAIATAAEFFQVDVSQLSIDQRYSIVVEELRIRAKRDLLLFSFAIVTAIVLAAVTITASLNAVGPGPAPNNVPVAQNGVAGDAQAKRAEISQTRINSFAVRIPNVPAGDNGLRLWVRAGDVWEERIPDGRIMNHRIEGRISLNSCDGTKSRKEENQGLEFFVPDQGCPGMMVMFRRTGSPWSPWLPMFQINSI